MIKEMVINRVDTIKIKMFNNNEKKKFKIAFNSFDVQWWAQVSVKKTNKTGNIDTLKN
jgi:hypothetical protein